MDGRVMTIDQEEMCNSLLQWLVTFDAVDGEKSAEELSSGVILAKVLQEVDPAFFDEQWFSRMSTEAGIDSNRHLKVSNLKKIWKRLSEFYTEVLGQSVGQFTQPDVNKIESADKAELYLLLQVILGSVVNCVRKEEYIGRIMKLEESIQHMVMRSIQDLQRRQRPASFLNDEGLQLEFSQTMEELKAVREARDEFAQKCYDLDAQVAQLQEERNSLLTENDSMKERLSDSEDWDNPRSSAGRKILLVTEKLKETQEELFRCESMKEDYKFKVEKLERDNKELLTKAEEISVLEDSNHRLRDELDELKSKLAEAKKAEASLDTYRKRLDEMGDLKMQLHLLEEKNDSYMKSAIDLEEEQRKTGALRTQLEAYKAQLQELQGKFSSEVKRADKAEFEHKRIQEKSDATTREKERLIAELDTVKELNDELKMDHLNSFANTSESSGDEAKMSDSSILMATTPEIREKLMRLEHENKLLKVSNKERVDGQTAVLENERSDALARVQELETESRLANQKILQLEASVSDMQEVLSKSEDGESGDMKVVTAKQKQIESLQLDVARYKQQFVNLEKIVGEKDTGLKMLESNLEKSRNEENRYKSYLAKARTVIENLEKASSQGPGESGLYSRADVDAMRRELQEKTQVISRLQEENDRSRIMFEQEERLITTAFHSMALQLHRHSSNDRLSQMSRPEGGRSFLSRQRQITSLRTTPLEADRERGNSLSEFDYVAS